MEDHEKHAQMLKKAQNAQFVREDLFPIIERAKVLALVTPNPQWKRAYEDLAQAASTLDAFIARSTVNPSQGPKTV